MGCFNAGLGTAISRYGAAFRKQTWAAPEGASRSIAPPKKRRAEGSAASAQHHKRHESEDQRRHHHDGETVGGLYKVQERLNLRSRIAGGCLLDLVHHFASYFGAFMKN